MAAQQTYFGIWELIKYSKSTDLASHKLIQKFILSLNKNALKRLIQKYIHSLLPEELVPTTQKEAYHRIILQEAEWSLLNHLGRRVEVYPVTHTQPVVSKVTILEC